MDMDSMDIVWIVQYYRETGQYTVNQPDAAARGSTGGGD